MTLLFGAAPAACSDDDNNVDSTHGALSVTVDPSSANVVVTGPASYTKTFVGNQILIDLAPGQYTANATATGYGNATSQINVVANRTSNINIIMQSTSSAFGSLSVSVDPATATVVMSGPDNFSATFTGNQLLTGLAPGEYTASATADGFKPATSRVNVVTGLTSSIAIVMRDAEPTVGALIVNVSPASATSRVTGPGNFDETFIGNHLLVELAPGQYTVRATAPGFGDVTSEVNVVAGQTSVISLVLVGRPIIADAPRAVYRDAAGNLISIDQTSIQSGKFVFYAWLDDEAAGLDASDLNAAATRDPGAPSLAEQTETAPSFTQNLAGAWVGYTDATGVVRPVIGADVRWEIDQWWNGRINSTQFGTSDDNRQALGYGVFDDQADTRTNNSRLANEGFPLIANEYPLYNQAGVGSPFIDGFTWVTLFSPDARASSRVVVVATINGEEIGKQILFKRFAPAPSLQITKTVNRDVVNLVGGTGTVTWTVTVRNVGSGDATDVDLVDTLSSGPGASYSIVAPAGTSAVGDGFTTSFALDSEVSPTPPTAQILGAAQSFAVLSSTAVTNTGASIVSGNVGTSAGAAPTGFPPGVVLNGTVHDRDAAAIAAQAAVGNAFTNLGEAACTGANNPTLDNRTLTPGVYCFDAAAALNGALVLDAQGDANAVFIFKIATTLTTGAGATVRLVNGASTCNVYWRVGGATNIGINNFFAGSILGQTAVTLGAGANIAGRALSRAGAVTLATNAIAIPQSCGAAGGGAKTFTFTATVTEPGTYCNEAKVVEYSDEDNTWTPIDLEAEACFTVLESDVSIVKDFVADDLTTSLGKSKTVSANVPAKLRVRVVNGGGGNATGVAVSDTLTSGDGTKYSLISVSNGTPNATDGFNTTVGNLAAGATVTLLFTVVATGDGVYCDTATVTATSGTIGVGSDTACLTVATPNLTITKTDSPQNVIPGSTYTSTIVVTNTGTATARGVVIADVLGLNPVGNIRAIYVSSNLAGLAGTLANNTVTSGVIDIPAGQSVTFTVVSRVPPGAIAGEYCDTATVTATNAGTRQASDCIDVPAFSALQTSLVDQNDPIAVGGEVGYFSVLFVEANSNEGVGSNEILYSFGLFDLTDIGDAGDFRVVSTRVYLDTAPIRDPATGLVVSDPSNPTASLLTASSYTIDNSTPGLQSIVLTPNIVLQPNTALYVVHVVSVPAGTRANHLYTTSFIWDSVGLVNPTNTYQASSSEPTTVLP